MAEEQIKALTTRVEKLEALTEQLAAALEALPPAPVKAAPLKPSHPLHPARRGQPDYEKKRKELMDVRPSDKGYEQAQAELREAGIL
jgi:hypothetical protein